MDVPLFVAETSSNQFDSPMVAQLVPENPRRHAQTYVVEPVETHVPPFAQGNVVHPPCAKIYISLHYH